MQYGGGLGDSAAPEPAAVTRADFKPLSEPLVIADTPAGTDVTTSSASAPLAPAEDFTAPEQTVSITAEQPVELAALDDGAAVLSQPPGPDSLPGPLARPEPDTPSCDILADASVEAGAMVRFSIGAPCLPNERVVVHH